MTAIARTKHGPVEYRSVGQGPSILVLNGGHTNCHSPLGHERFFLNLGYQMLIPSRPGYGKTPSSVGRTAEAFADVAGTEHLFGPPVEIAKAIRQRVRTELGLAISVGVARTKHLAKIASQVAKPDGLLVVFNSIPVAVLVSVTETLGMTAWVVSCTVPRTLPLLDCGQAGAARKTSRSKPSLTKVHVLISRTS